MTLDEKSIEILITKLCNYVGCENKLNDLKGNLKDIYESLNYQPKKIKILVDLISKGKNYEEIEKFFKKKEQGQKIIEEELNENIDLSKIYYLLSIMPCGLPNSLIKLIYPDFNMIMNQKNNLNEFIFIDPEDNWIHLNDFKKDNYNSVKNNEKQDCILYSIKIYSKNYYIFILIIIDKHFYIQMEIFIIYLILIMILIFGKHLIYQCINIVFLISIIKKIMILF